MLTQNHMPTTMEMSKWKPELEFQYGGGLFPEIWNSSISAVDWAILSKFGKQKFVDLLKCANHETEDRN